MGNISFKELKSIDPNYKKIYDEAYKWDKKHMCFTSYDNNLELSDLFEKKRLMYLDDELIGYGTIFIDVINNIHEACLSYVINPKYRKLGYGYILLKYLMDESRDKLLCDSVRVRIFKKNVASISLVEKSEFDFEFFDDKAIVFSKKL